MSRLQEKLRSGEFVVTTELTPPKGINLEDIFAKAALLKPCVDAVNLTDSPRARMAIEPKSVGHLLLDRGVEPIVQITSRDRNRIAVQGDILGAAALGITNFVFMAGDQPKNGDHPDAKAVFDLSTTDLLKAARSLREGHDLAGNELKGAPEIFIGATANPGGKDLDAEVANARGKIDAGAQFLQTQAVFDPPSLKGYLRQDGGVAQWQCARHQGAGFAARGDAGGGCGGTRRGCRHRDCRAPDQAAARPVRRGAHHGNRLGSAHPAHPARERSALLRPEIYLTE